MKYLILLLLTLLTVYSCFSQEKHDENVNLNLSIPNYLVFNEANTHFRPDSIRTGRSFNYGLDATVTIPLSRVKLHLGAGYLRNRVNINRPYNSGLLNPGRDSILILQGVNFYRYDILRFPIGISYNLSHSYPSSAIGLQHFFNISFNRKYNGQEFYENQNFSHQSFDYLGNSLELFVNVPIYQSGKLIVSAQPFIRVLNRYKEDIYLYEYGKETLRRNFDAFGIAFFLTFK
jgi:hypothetical protein